MNKLCVYGPPGTGKTSLIGDMALYVKKTTGKKTRVVTADGGGIEPLLPGIEFGYIEAVDISNWPNPFATFQYLSSGWWPVDPSVVGSALKPGFRDYKECCFCGKDTGAVGLAAVKQCTSCNKAIPPGTILKPVRQPINGMEEVGAYGIEGLTSWGDRLMQAQADKLAAGDPGASIGNGEKEKGGATLRFQDGVDPEGKPVMVAGNAMPHYGSSVDYLSRYVRNSDSLPGWKLWTALEKVGKDEDTKKNIMGPSVPGRIGVDKVIGWFNSVLHISLEEGKPDANGIPGVDRKMFLNPHFTKEAPGVPFVAKLSAPPSIHTPKVIKPSFFEFATTLEKAREEAKKLIEENLRS